MQGRSILLIAAFIFCAARAASAAGSLTVATTPLSFGLYDPFSPVPLDGQGDVQVTYVPGANPNPPIPYTITISSSPNSGSIDPRTMKQTPPTADSLNYNVYTDPGRTVVWSDIITGGADNVTDTNRRNLAQPQITQVYGRIPALQDVGVGSYSDSLVVTITW